MGKVFVFDAALCNGCHCCQIACKDEHCGVDWLPYAAAQPETGQFWCKVDETVHGTVPRVNITYEVGMCGHCDTCALMDIAPDAVSRRDDGLVIIDPEKAKGRRDLVDACSRYVFWNEELEVPQKCTGCAHLLDDGWDEPRCVNACYTKALRFGEKEDFAEELENAEQPMPGSNFYYLNRPKRWIGGDVYDEDADEVVIGARVELLSGGSVVGETETDEFGDYWFRQIDGGVYTVRIEADGYETAELEADVTQEDRNVGSLAMAKFR